MIEHIVFNVQANKTLSDTNHSMDAGQKDIHMNVLHLAISYQ